MSTLNHHAWTFKIILTRSWQMVFFFFFLLFLNLVSKCSPENFFCLSIWVWYLGKSLIRFRVLWTSLSSQSVNPSLKSGRTQQWIHLGLSPFLNQVGFVLYAPPSILLFVIDLFRLLIPSWPSFRISYTSKNYFFLDFSNFMFSKYILFIF